ncbi:hypothetical protein D3C84_594490 [compost metagenome]
MVSPISRRVTITSTVIMASSTNSPRAMINAPREIRCMVMPLYSMKMNTMASTSGIEHATTRPARIPKLTKLTTSTMITASNKALVKPPTASSTTTA